MVCLRQFAGLLQRAQRRGVFAERMVANGGVVMSLSSEHRRQRLASQVNTIVFEHGLIDLERRDFQQVDHRQPTDVLLLRRVREHHVRVARRIELVPPP